jgi:hypothetical protein
MSIGAWLPSRFIGTEQVHKPFNNKSLLVEGI